MSRIRCLAVLGQRSKSLLVLQYVAKRGRDCDKRYKALEAMLVGWRNNSFITLVTLVDRAQKDPHRDVQRLAVDALAGTWKHHPVGRQCLQQITESNTEWGIKFVAIEALQDW